MARHHSPMSLRFVDAIRQGAIAGIAAGVVFALVWMIVAEVLGGGSSEPWRLFASIPLGPDVLLGPFTLTIGLVGVAVHAVLSALFGLVWSTLAYQSPSLRVRSARHVLAAMVFGVLLYLVNVELIARFAFPWFLELNRGVQILLHAIAYGLPLGFYLFVQIQPPVPALSRREAPA